MFVLMKSKHYRDLGNWLLSGSSVVPAELHHVWTGTSRTKSASTIKPKNTEWSPKGEISQLSTKICTEVFSAQRASRGLTTVRLDQTREDSRWVEVGSSVKPCSPVLTSF